MQSLEEPDYEKRESFVRTDLDLINADVTLPWPPRSPDVTPLGVFSLKCSEFKNIGL